MKNEGERFVGRTKPAGKQWLLSAALAVAAFAATLGVLEVGFRLAGYEAIYEVYSKPSIFWRHDSLLGWSHQPDSSGTYVGPRPWPIEFRTPVRINSEGLRGPEITALPPDGVRILFLGDSVVAAFEVAYESTFVALVGQRLQRHFALPIQVLNGGVRGYGTDQSYLYYRERGRLLRPDLVVLVHSLNDLTNNMTLHRMRRPFGKPAFALTKTGLSLRGSPVPRYPLCSAWIFDEKYQPRRIDSFATRAVCWTQTNLSDHSALFTFLGLRIRRRPELLRRLYDLGTPSGRASLGRTAASARASVIPLAVGGPEPKVSREAAYELTAAIIRELSREVRASGADFALIIRGSEFDQLEPEAMRRAGIQPIEVLITTAADEGTIRFENDSHYNSRGHYLAAQALAPAMAERIETVLARRR